MGGYVGAICARCRWKLDAKGLCPCDDAWWSVGVVSRVDMVELEKVMVESGITREGEREKVVKEEWRETVEEYERTIEKEKVRGGRG